MANGKITRTKAHKELIEALLEARRETTLRQHQAAKRLGKSQTWIARIESGERRVDVVEFLMLCRVYHIDPHALLRKLARFIEPFPTGRQGSTNS